MNKVDEIYEFFSQKEKKTNRIFIVLNVIAILLAAALIIMNLFAIRFNPVKANGSSNDSLIIWMFVAVSIVVGLAAATTSISSIFLFRKRATAYREKKEKIKEEQDKYKSNKGPYKKKADKDKTLIERVLKIVND